MGLPAAPAASAARAAAAANALRIVFMALPVGCGPARLSRAGLGREGLHVDRRRRLPPLLAMLRDDGREDAPAHEEACGESHEARARRAHEVVEDLVRHRLVEAALVAEG